VLVVEQKLMKRKMMERPGLTWADAGPNGASIIDRDEQVNTGEALIFSTRSITSFDFSVRYHETAKHRSSELGNVVSVP
jgi:hypothetical protein